MPPGALIRDRWGEAAVTLDEANARLPLVRAVVKDAMERWKELKSLRGRISKLEREGADEVAIRRFGAHAEELEEAIRGYSRELEQIGVQFKDPEIGLVDFPECGAERGPPVGKGRDIYAGGAQGAVFHGIADNPG